MPSSSLVSIRVVLDPGLILLGGSCGLISVEAATSAGDSLLSWEIRFSGEAVPALAAAIDRLGRGTVGGAFDFDGIPVSRGFGAG